MRSRIFGTFWVTTICCIISAATLLELPAEEYDAMSIAPSRIILNAECVGSLQDIQAIFPFVWPSNYEFVEGKFYFGDDEVPDAYHSFHYCVDDDILLVSFDRGMIQAYAKDNGLAGDVLVMVSCTFNVTGAEPDELRGTDLVEILTPGKKK